ncbi:hypothetical protein SAMN05444141_102108 [Pseudovibrio denitrificans]|uniref:Uncharacterized protein n=1 Tax=Pseudovibrio denitrificans TaxID=258256 RepID=A0A1I6Z6I5_9HYPH|nr:hypothetical protein SAMN05444141_102108 [Pseudovibrio denitrificans]
MFESGGLVVRSPFLYVLIVLSDIGYLNHIVTR